MSNSCEERIKAGNVLIGGDYGCFNNYKVELFNGSTPLRDNVLRADNIGRRIQAKVTDLRTSNACSGVLNVVDNAPPQILKPEDVTVSCSRVPVNGAPSVI